jgi:hypothetical protein
VYLSISNLSASVIKLQNVPSNILVSMLPVTKHKDALLWARIYYMSIEKLLKRKYIYYIYIALNR